MRPCLRTVFGMLLVHQPDRFPDDCARCGRSLTRDEKQHFDIYPDRTYCEDCSPCWRIYINHRCSACWQAH